MADFKDIQEERLGWKLVIDINVICVLIRLFLKQRLSVGMQKIKFGMYCASLFGSGFVRAV